MSIKHYDTTPNIYFDLDGKEFMFHYGGKQIPILFTNETQSTNFQPETFRLLQSGLNHFIAWCNDNHPEYIQTVITKPILTYDPELVGERFNKTLENFIDDNQDLSDKSSKDQGIELIISKASDYCIRNDIFQCILEYVDNTSVYRVNSKPGNVDIENFLSDEDIYLVNVTSMIYKIIFLVYMYKPTYKFKHVAYNLIYKISNMLIRSVSEMCTRYEFKSVNSAALRQEVYRFDMSIKKFATNKASHKLEGHRYILNILKRQGTDQDILSDQLYVEVIGNLHKLVPIDVSSDLLPEGEERKLPVKGAKPEVFRLHDMYDVITGELKKDKHHEMFKYVNINTAKYMQQIIDNGAGNLMKVKTPGVLEEIDMGEDYHSDSELMLEKKDIILYKQSKIIMEHIIQLVQHTIEVDGDPEGLVGKHIFSKLLNQGGCSRRIKRHPLNISMVWNVIDIYGGDMYVFQILNHDTFTMICIMLYYRLIKLGYPTIATAILGDVDIPIITDISKEVSMISNHIYRQDQDITKLKKISSIIGHYYKGDTGSVSILYDFYNLLLDNKYTDLFELNERG